MSEAKLGERLPPGRRLGGVVLSWVLVVVGLRAIVLHPEQCVPVDTASVTAAATEASAWLARNQHADGSWLYRYDSDDDVDLGGYNIVRHGGVTMSLYQAHTAGIAGALESADAGTEWAVERLVPAGGGRALGQGRSLSTGASALWVAGLVERRETTGDPVYDDLLFDLGTFLVGSVEENGAVSAAYLTETGDFDRGNHSIFFTGEIYWAVARLDRAFPGEGYGAAAARIERYLATERDDAEDLFPPPADHWAAYGLATSHGPATADVKSDAPGMPEGYVARQARLFGPQVRYESQRTNSTWSYVTRGRQTLGAGLGTLGEGLGNLWFVVDDADRDAVAERAVCVAGMLVDRQADGSSADPAERGAWFQFGVTQMDDQQHSLSALLLALPILEERATR